MADEDVASGVSRRAWAAASARTLARRQRRAWRAQVGLSRASALHARTQAFRLSLQAHWRLGDRLGIHFSSHKACIDAARLLKVNDDLCDSGAALSLGNWARHAPPPSSVSAKSSPPGALHAVALEQFRSTLYQNTSEADARDQLLQALVFSPLPDPLPVATNFHYECESVRWPSGAAAKGDESYDLQAAVGQAHGMAEVAAEEEAGVIEGSTCAVVDEDMEAQVPATTGAGAGLEQAAPLPSSRFEDEGLAADEGKAEHLESDCGAVLGSPHSPLLNRPSFLASGEERVAPKPPYIYTSEAALPSTASGDFSGAVEALAADVMVSRSASSTQVAVQVPARAGAAMSTVGKDLGDQLGEVERAVDSNISAPSVSRKNKKRRGDYLDPFTSNLRMIARETKQAKRDLEEESLMQNLSKNAFAGISLFGAQS